MVNQIVTRWLQCLGGEPCFRIWGKARVEPIWRIISVYATNRRNLTSRWPLCGGTCITWTDRIIVVGWDFAEIVVQEQHKATQRNPIEVLGGRIGDRASRQKAGAPTIASASEILAHECGHTWQALRLGSAYLPLVGSVTLFREGNRFWNYYENQASELGQFGGIQIASICPRLLRVRERFGAEN